MSKFRKKPVVIEAIQWNGYLSVFTEWLDPPDGGSVGLPFTIVDAGTPQCGIEIDTLEGKMTARPGDWIIRGVAGEFYPCKPDIFAATYEAVSDDGKTAGPEGSAEAPLGRSEHIPTPEGRGGETLTTLLRRAKQTLCVPAAEYVPAMGDAMLLLDKAIQMSYQTDPNWLLSSPRVEEVRREALEEAAKVVEPTNGPPCDCITLHDDEWWMPHCDCRNGGDSDEAQSWCTSKNEARRIRALSPPVG